MAERLIKVELLSDVHSAHFGKYVYISPSRANALERRGIVRVIGDVDNESATITFKNTEIVPDGFDFKNNSFPRIAWVQDLSKTGGAELSNNTVIAAGIKAGFSIARVTPSQFNLESLRAAHVVILNNLFEFSDSQLKGIIATVIEKGTPFIKYDHDLRELKRKTFSRSLFNRSIKNIFISPTHLRLYTDAFGVPFQEKSVVLPLAIDADLFVNRNEPRPANSVLVPNPAKVSKNLRRFIASREGKKFTYTLVGQSIAEINATTVPKTDSAGMVALYNRHESVYLELDTLEPGCRIYFEAWLCGCRVISNANVGHTSWNYTDENVREKLTAAVGEFWGVIKACLTV